MPRPKRSKIAPSAPTKLPHQRDSSKPINASAVQKQRNIFSPASSGCITSTSDDSDGLVISRKPARSILNNPQQEYTMSGALAFDDVGNTRLKPLSGKTRAELMRITREADYAQKLEVEGVKASSPNADETDLGQLDEIPSSVPKDAAHILEDLSSSSSNARNASLQPSVQVRIGSRMQETPRLPSSRVLHSAFKKRPRQPSLLQIAQSQDQSQMEKDDDEIYDLLPDDESTPLVKSIAQAHEEPVLPGPRKRQRMTPEVQVLASQSRLRSARSHSSTPSQPEAQEDLYNISAREDSPQPQLPCHRSTQTPPPQIFSDTLAPPQSSSPEKARRTASSSKSTKASSKPKPANQQRKRKGDSRPASPLLPTSVQVSYARAPKTKPLTTATLQNLLPRRRVRNKPKNDYDMPSSSDIELDNTGLGGDEDELSFHATKVRRKNPGLKPPKGIVKRKDAAAKKTPKTYTRKSITVSEDEDDDHGASGGEDENGNIAVGKKAVGLDSKAKAEMRRLADKFREVDEYSLDFEDMTGSSSQMKDAR